MYLPYRTVHVHWHVHCTVRTCAAHTGSHVDASLSYHSEPVRIGLFTVAKLTVLTYRDSIRHVKLTARVS